MPTLAAHMLCLFLYQQNNFMKQEQVHDSYCQYILSEITVENLVWSSSVHRGRKKHLFMHFTDQPTM